jgi:adenylate cyclase
LQLRGYQGRQFCRSLAAGLVSAACGLALVLTPFGTTFERTFGLDWLFKIRGARTPPPEVAVIGINSGTGRALGLPRLPHDWPRTVHARLIDRLVEQNARGIVFDIDFSRSKPGDEDAVLAGAISKADRVVLFEWLSRRRERVLTANGGDGGWTWAEQMNRQPLYWRMRPRRSVSSHCRNSTRPAFELWLFKPSAGDALTMAAVAPQPEI